MTSAVAFSEIVAVLALLSTIWCLFLVRKRDAEHRQMTDSLRRSHDDLEKMVAERTVEIAKTNEALKAEIAERRTAEDESLYVASGAGCLLWHATVEDRDDRYHWRIRVLNEE